MSYEQFWLSEAELYWAYQTAFIMNEKRKNEYDNNFAWLQGLYIFQGISAALSNSNRSKPSDPISEYLSEPIDFTKTKDDIIKSEQDKFEDRMKAYLESKSIKLNSKGKK